MPSPLLPRALTAVLLVSAIVAIIAVSGDPAWMPAHYVAKPLATIAAFLLALTARDPVSPRYRVAISAGLAFSLIGDVLLMLPTDMFAAGLGAFLVAQCWYISAFLGQSRWLGRPVVLVGYTLVAATLMAALYPVLPPALRIPVVTYVVVITLMATQSGVWMLASPSDNSRRAAIGAAFFLASDATLAIARFRADVPYRELIVLGTYYIAQWCLARSVSRGVSRRVIPASLRDTATRLGLILIVGAAVAPMTVVPTQSLHAQQSPVTVVPPAMPRLMRAGDVDTIPLHRTATRIAYGQDSLQFGELRLPDGRGPFPLAIVVHGGCWMSRYASLRNTAALAEAMTDAGIATWNIEYRRYDHPGGGWPGTFRDIADGADYVRTLATRFPLDTTRIVATGHSAGGHLALWLATRRTLDTSSPLAGGAPIALKGIVSVGGIADLPEFFAREKSTCGNPAIESLLGGVPDSVPQRVHDASPIMRLPLRVPSVHIAGELDRVAPLAVRDAFATAARASGDSAWVVTALGAGHFETITPSRPGGRLVIDAVKQLLSGPYRAPLPEKQP